MQIMRCILFALILSLWSCSDTPDPLFQLNAEADFNLVPGLNTFETFYFPIDRIATNYDLLSNGVDPVLVSSIQPSRAIISAPFIDFDWSIVREVSVWAISVKDPELRAEVFFQDRINFNEQNELRLFSSLSDVKEIMMEDSFNLEVRFNFRNITPAQIRCRIEMNFIANGTE